MAQRYVLERTQTVKADLSEVTRFFENPRNLEALTPPFLNFRIETKGDIEMMEGAFIDYKIRLHGFPMRWRTRIVQYNPGQDFVDFQVQGPYRYWHHLHTFRATSEGTEIGDQVTYELPLGPVGQMVHALMVRRQLNTIFDYRTTVIQERFS